MGKIIWNGGALVAPVPAVMVTCGDMENSNIITIGWTGIINTDPPKTYISVRPKRHSYSMIKESGEFVINLTPSSFVRQADFCGIYTGAKTDKFERCGFDKIKGSKVACPIIAQSPLSLECKITEIIPLGTHDMFLADIVAVDVDDALIDDSGKLRLDKAELCAYAHGDYFELGKKLGHIGFSTEKGGTISIKNANRSKSNEKSPLNSESSATSGAKPDKSTGRHNSKDKAGTKTVKSQKKKNKGASHSSHTLKGNSQSNKNRPKAKKSASRDQK